MTRNNVFLTLIFLLAFVISGSIFVYAKISDITFPVKELGNCKSEQECKIYCDDSAHIIECVTFAEEHGLISKDEAKRAREFADIEKGPGGCDSRESCEVYCEDINHMEECLAFAEKHNLISKEEIKEARAVARALRKGAKLPGGCTDKASCEAYCSEPSHIQECVNFAEAAGFISRKEAAEVRKIMPLMQRGEMPGGCRSKQQCETYCADDAHFEECITFAEKAGFVSREEAEMARKTGGKGPGGCRSKEQCDVFCNKPENQQICFEFAKKHNLISKEQLKEMEQGMARLKQGVKQAPAEVISCLENQIGPNVINEIEAGTLVPGPAMGNKIKSCFDIMMKQGLQKMREGLSKFSPEGHKCIEDKIGADIIRRIEAGEMVDIGPEMGEVFKECAGTMQKSMLNERLQGLPPETQNCIRGKFTPEVMSKLQSGKMDPEKDIQALIKDCISDMGISDIPEGGIPEDFEPDETICAKFKLAPSCSFVPEQVRGLCQKCKSR